MLIYRRDRLATSVAPWTNRPRHGLWAAASVMLVGIVATALTSSTSAAGPALDQAASVFRPRCLSQTRKPPRSRPTNFGRC